MQCYNFCMPCYDAHYAEVRKVIAGKAVLTVVTKKRSVDQIMYYYDHGERCFGENHAQELVEKAEVMPKDIQWQFIGHLQRNKVRMILPYVDRIQSLDSLELAQEIEKECAKENRTMKCLAEFHLAQEDENKTGLRKEDAFSFLDACAEFPHVNIEGIMVMGPHTEDKTRIKEVFQDAHNLYLSLQERYGQGIHILSMGMSADYPIAVECGSNMVRVGTYLFTEDK